MAEAFVDMERYFVNHLEENSNARKLCGQTWCEMREYADIWMEVLQEQIEHDRCKTRKCCMKMNGSVYSGTAGLAMLDIFLAKTFEMADCDREQLLLRAAGHLECSLKKLKKCRMSFLAGDAGPLAITIVLYSDMVANGCNCECMVAKYLKQLLAFKEEATLPYLDTASEVVCGRAGYLWSLLYINQHYPNLIDPDIITDVVIAIVRAGKPCNGCLRKHLMYKWRGKDLLGAAHGLFGIIYVLLKAKNYWPLDEVLERELDPLNPNRYKKLTCEEKCELQKYMFCPETTMSVCNENVQEWVLETLHFLTTQIFASGNTLPSLGSGADKFVNWAHGGSGAVYTFIEAHKIFRHPHFLTAAVNCGECIWGRGLVKKGYGLTDGVAGNAYALMALFKHTKVETFLHGYYH
ncbi:unnamed protein product [Allacma fusca]|uniref:Uncharacterized protein n=1 Tax=Allacma fusca TaxID=39272 RepID=A0A8J2KCY0_9HEXA|nr:unnamed protein product [Allacma fusca]